jgi:ribosomal protein S11
MNKEKKETPEEKESMMTERKEIKKDEVKTEAVEEVVEVDPEKEKKDDRPGVAYIYTTSNNTFVHITDLAGNTISRITGGMVTKQSRLKSSPTIAMFVAKKAAERAKDLGITSLYVKMRGRTGEPSAGPGGHAAVKALSKEGFRVINVLDTTRVARGGPKKKGGKRGRRV